jgi:hypothetical protein
MHNVVGPPVRGDDFFDREAEQRQMWRSLEDHHVLLLAPRRVGKTSLMYRLAEQARHHGYQAVYESAVKCETELALVSQLYKALALKDEAVAVALTGGRLGRLVKKVKGIKAFGVEVVLSEVRPDEWVPLGEELIEALRGSDQRALILLDELPVFVTRLLEQADGRARARRLLDWMRDARQGTVEGADRFRWLLAGSIGLDAVTQRLGLGASINDLLVQRLGPFEEASALEFLTRLGRQYALRLDEEARGRVLARTGWLIPHHLQLFFHHLRGRELPAGATVSAGLVDEVFDELGRPASRACFDPWYQRLSEELGAPRDAQARALLSACARDPEGASRAVLDQTLARQISDLEARAADLVWLLSVLENDGYVVLEGARHRFRSPLLRSYWLGRAP